MNTLCPLCAQLSTTQYKPFCSKLCKDKDLINWLDGKYAIPVAIEETIDYEAVEIELPKKLY